MTTPHATGPLGRFLTHPATYTTRLGQVLIHTAVEWAPLLLPTTFVAAVAVALLAGRVWRGRRESLARDARVVTLLAPPLADPAGAEALWGHLMGLARPRFARLLKGQPHLAFEYAWTGGADGGLTISVWVPGTIAPHLVEQAARAAWPGTHTTTTPAGPVLPAGALTVGGALRLARTEILPLRYGHDSDPLRALAVIGAGLGEGEHAVLQVLARPAAGRRVARAHRAAYHLNGGNRSGLLPELLDLITPGPPARRGTARRDVGPERSAEVRAAVGKLGGPLWETRLHYAAATTATHPDSPPAQVMDARERLRGVAHALASATAQYAARNWLARQKLRDPTTAVNGRGLGRGGLVSVPELAALAHLPTDDALPGLARAGARATPPIPAIARPGPWARPLGVSDAGIPRPVAVSVADGRHHMRVIGPTGTGKTTLILSQLLADAEAGRGAVFCDPKGDAVTDLIARLPEECAGRVVLIDPGDPAPPPCLNVLQGDTDGGDFDVITDNITGIFARIFSAFWGPRTDDIFRAACLTLLQSVPPGSGNVTLADIPKLLGQDAYRARTTASITDPVLKGFWDWYEQLSVPARAQAVGPLMNKLRAFLLRRFARQAIAAGPSTFTLAKVLDEGGLCLARLPKGVLGEETSRLLGSFIVAATWQAASRRARQPQAERRDAGLYLDEAHNFLNLPYPLEDVLAEARAYRLSVVLAHQNLAQLPPDLAAGISANARSQVIFSVSPEDARTLERHTLPVLTAHDLSHLGAYQAAARVITADAESPAFTLRSVPLPPAIAGRTDLIRRAARATTASPLSTAPRRAIARQADPRG